MTVFNGHFTRYTSSKVSDVCHKRQIKYPVNMGHFPNDAWPICNRYRLSRPRLVQPFDGISVMSIKHLPISTPPLSVLLHDLCSPHPRDLARALGAGERTVRRWMAEDAAPRPVMLSLFWVSTWGRQWLDADQHNRLVMQMNIAQALARELDHARAQLHDQDATAQMQTAPRLPQAPRLLYVVN